MTSRRTTTQDPVYAKRWRLDRSRGIKRLVDAAPVRDHVRALLAAGASQRSIADAAATSPSVISGLLAERHATLQRTTAARILRVRPADIFDRPGGDDFVPKVGAVRRVQALQAVGHSAATIGATVRQPASFVHNKVNQRGDWISRRSHDLIVQAYESLWNVPGSSVHVRSRAARAGWPPPLAWDDDTIDDPNATPATDATAPDHDTVDEAAVQRRIDGDHSVLLTRADRLEVVRRLHASGLTDGDIERATGINKTQALRDRKRLGLPANVSAA